jgi:hypothetical protein
MHETTESECKGIGGTTVIRKRYVTEEGRTITRGAVLHRWV